VRARDFSVPLVLLGAITAIIVVQGRQMGRDRGARRAAQPMIAEQSAPVEPQGKADSAAGATAKNPELAGLVEVRLSGEPAPVRDDAAIRTQLIDAAPGTYLLDILQQQERLLMRWPERRAEALRVWIERNPDLPDWQANYPVVAEHAFDEWREAGFPIRFDIVTTDANSDIQIKWVKQFSPTGGAQIGLTKKVRNQHGWIVSAEISIATHDGEGHPLSPTLIAGIARHEVGHALGLGHSRNITDVMYPESTTPVISDADRATLHLLYMLPPGVVK
jgi:predicted Zn-dependent protease